MTPNSATTADDFSEFVEAHSKRLLRLAYVLTGGREAAEDLVQETLAEIFWHWSRVRRSRHREAYVRRMLMNRYLSGERRRRVEQGPFNDALVGPGSSSGTAGVEDQVVLWRAIATLSSRQQAALVLRYYEGLDDGEIAGILGCRPATVRSLVSRALTALRASSHLQVREGTGTPLEDR